ncbi:unnamed protein product [Oppiella nova]|uniref:Uncharacterized protein n=1 Tax=Oppiella nova TaxID=334625 RepID=A0A7R9QQ10_9ACAR|nr:unnamed protein product [Oppiella nova]CAG2170127.1 unnamed protein product [Oppiella nova]
MSKRIDLTGKVVLITGSSSGIGAQTAVEFARHGAQVVVTGREGYGDVSEVAKQCREVSPKHLQPLEVVADVGDVGDCRRLIGTTIDTFTRIDVLVNNAAKGVQRHITDQDIMAHYDDCMDTNMRSVVLLTHLCAPHLAKTNGVIVNISSAMSTIPTSGGSLYTMFKSAIDMLTKCVALELAPNGIRVNSVNPGGIHTAFVEAMGFTKQQSDAVWDLAASETPIGRVGQPLDIANAVIYMASPETSFVTGTTFYCDGGYALNH